MWDRITRIASGSSSTTPPSLLAEAAKARDIGCDLSYLDPGRETSDGTTLWDEEQPGKAIDFAPNMHASVATAQERRVLERDIARWPAYC